MGLFLFCFFQLYLFCLRMKFKLGMDDWLDSYKHIVFLYLKTTRFKILDEFDVMASFLSSQK